MLVGVYRVKLLDISCIGIATDLSTVDLKEESHGRQNKIK